VEVDGDRGRVVPHLELTLAAQVELDLSVDRRADEDRHPADLGCRAAVDVAADDQLGRGTALEELAERITVFLGQAYLVELPKAPLLPVRGAS
jgi:hypothetical protein